MAKNKVLIAGASGLVGKAAARSFAANPDWDVIGVSRRQPDDLPGVTLLAVDLTDEGQCQRVFGELSDVTHLIYAALHEIPGLMPGWVDEDTIQRNALMLRNLFDPLSRAAKDLQHVSLLHGTKAYGLHHPDIGLENIRNPLREREPRVEHRNFYFLQEDYLLQEQSRGNWGLTIFRPTVIYGDAAGNNMNPILAIGAYAALMRERGEPLHFPGQTGASALREAVDADLVAHALEWAATSPAAKGGTFNLTNGDVFIWENIWPAIAKTLGMAAGEARPMSFSEELPKRSAEWAAIVKRYSLRASEDIVEFVGYNSLVYTDLVLSGANRSVLPILNSTIAARQAGFHECMDTEDMFVKWMQRLVDQRVLPSPN